MKNLVIELNKALLFIENTISLNSSVRDVLFSNIPAPSVRNTALMKLYDHRNRFTNQSIQKRQFDSSLAIVCIYSAFELFIDSIIEDYVATINSIVPRFCDLPETLVNNHTPLSISLLQKASSRNIYPLTEADIVNNIHSVLMKQNSSQLNSKAYSLHTNNIRTATLTTLFQHLGFGSFIQSLINEPTLSNYLITSGLAATTEKISFLDDLVVSRNDVSHGWRLQTFPSDNVLLDTASHIRELCMAIYRILTYDLVSKLISHKKIIPIGRKVEQVIRNGVVSRLFIFKRYSVSVGDKLFYIHESNGKVRNCVSVIIKSIQKDNTIYSSYTPSNLTDIGIETDKVIKKGGVFFAHRGGQMIPEF